MNYADILREALIDDNRAEILKNMENLHAIAEMYIDNYDKSISNRSNEALSVVLDAIEKDIIEIRKLSNEKLKEGTDTTLECALDYVLDDVENNGNSLNHSVDEAVFGYNLNDTQKKKLIELAKEELKTNKLKESLDDNWRGRERITALKDTLNYLWTWNHDGYNEVAMRILDQAYDDVAETQDTENMSDDVFKNQVRLVALDYLKDYKEDLANGVKSLLDEGEKVGQEFIDKKLDRIFGE